MSTTTIYKELDYYKKKLESCDKGFKEQKETINILKNKIDKCKKEQDDFKKALRTHTAKQIELNTTIKKLQQSTDSYKSQFKDISRKVPRDMLRNQTLLKNENKKLQKELEKLRKKSTSSK